MKKNYKKKNNIYTKERTLIMFEEKLRSFIARIDGLKENIQTEEATKTSLIMPFFAMLGYDVLTLLNLFPNLSQM